MLWSCTWIGNECPAAVSNFKSLCMNEGGYGYTGSSIFRVISQFSVQGTALNENMRCIQCVATTALTDTICLSSVCFTAGGNIGQPDNTLPSQLSRYGRAGDPYPSQANTRGRSFLPDNFRILHSYRDAGVVSMMRDITKKGLLDSR